MSANVKNSLLLGIKLFFLTICLCGAGQNTQQPSLYDGNWWLAKSENERTGFLEGYFDCYSNEYRSPDRYTNGINQYVTAITKRYKNDGFSALKRPITTQIHELRDKPGMSIVNQNGEKIISLAGLEWMQLEAMSGTDNEQIGFIEGYLACHVGLNHSYGGIFSQSPDTYVNDISRWYGFVKSTGDINPARDEIPIKNVLFMFADTPERSLSGGN